jgi:hypothetical protein
VPVLSAAAGGVEGRSMVEGVLRPIRRMRSPLHHAATRRGPSPRSGEDFLPPCLRLATAQVLAERFGQPLAPFLVGFAHQEKATPLPGLAATRLDMVRVSGDSAASPDSDAAVAQW